MKTLLKNYTFYFWLFAVISILLSFYLYHKYSYTNNRIDQVEGILQLQKSIMRPEDVTSSEAAIKIDSLSRLLEVQELKEEYYLNQLDTLSDWFILYVTGLTALFGFVGFSTLKTLEERVTQQEKSNKEQFKVFEDKSKWLEAESEDMMGNIHSMGGDLYRDIKRVEAAVVLKILAVEHYIKALVISGRKPESNLSINYRIEDIFLNLGQANKLDLSDTAMEKIRNSIRVTIKNIQDEEMEKDMFEILNKLEQLTNLGDKTFNIS